VAKARFMTAIPWVGWHDSSIVVYGHFKTG
jgi:hypothetical protein